MIRFLEQNDFESGLLVVNTNGKGRTTSSFSTKMESMLPFACGKYLTKNGVAYVFNEKTKKFLGTVKKDPNSGITDLATIKEKATEDLYFDDLFHRA